MKPIIFSPESQQDLLNLGRYYYEVSQDYLTTDICIQNITMSIEKLSHFPHLGQYYETIDNEEVRKLYISERFLFVFYTVTENSIIIARILSSFINPSTILTKLHTS